MADAGDGEGHAARVGAAVRDHWSCVRAEQRREHLPSGRREVATPTGQDRETVARGALQPAQRVRGDVGAGREPVRDPGTILIGQPERRRHVAGQVGDERAVGCATGVQHGQHPGDDGGAGTALR